MPKYKLSNGKFIIVKDNDVQDFLNSDIGKGATIVEEIPAPVAIEDYVKTPGVNFDDYLKPVKTEDSASVDPTVESKDMGSKLVDTSSELQSAKPNRYLKFKGGKVVYEDEYLSKYAGKDGLPASFDDYAKMWKTKPLTFDSPEITVKSKKTEELIPSLKNAWKKREYNKDTEMYEPSFNDVLLDLDEEEAVEMFRSAYKGSGIEFEESNQIFDKKKGKELDSEVLFTDAVRMKILDKKTGEYIYSKPIELQRGEDFNERNESIINNFIESNKDKIDASKWVRTQNKQLIELEKWQEENFKPELKQKETQLKEKFLDNPNLFDAVDEIVPDIESSSVYTFGGGVSVPTTKTIKKYPYEKEIKQKVSLLSNKYPSKTKEEIEDLAKKSVRSDLYESARLDFMYAKNEEYLSNSSNVKKTQGLLYSAMLNKVNKEADKFNKSSKKIQLSQENFYQAEKDLNKVIKYYRIPDEDTNKEIGELFAKYDVDMVDSSETILDDEFNKKYGIKQGGKIPTNLYNIINRINSSADSNKNIISVEADKMSDAIDMMSDNSTIANAASKNYDLLEKYAMNTAIGFQDIAVGTAFLAGNILTLGQSETLKKKGVKYTKYANKLRDSYVRDVSFDNAFNSAENTGKFIAQEISNQIPILVAMAASGGFGGLTAGISSTGKQMMDMEYEIATGKAQYSDVEVWLKSAGFGVAEGVFSQLTTVRALGRARSRWISSGREQVLNNSMKEYFRSKVPTLIYEPLLESGGEALTTGTQNLITGRDFISDMDHSAVSGFGFGLLFAGTPFMKGMYNSRFSTYESLNEVRQAQRELVDLERRFATSQSPANSKSNKLIVDLINKKREKINDLVTSREKLINNNLTSGGASKIISLIQEQANLQNRFEDINNNNDLDQDTKNQLLAEIKQDFDFITRAKEKALSGNLLKANETEWEAFKALNKSKAETYMSEAESILKDERDGRDVQKADVNRKAYDLYYRDIVIEENSKLGKSDLFKNFTVFETVQDAINSLNNRDDLSDKDRKILINGLKNGNDGYADPNTGEAVAVVENQVRNQRRYTKVHEIGHQVFWKLLDNNSKAMKGIASQLLSTMKSIDKKLYEKFINDGIDDNRGNIIPAEVISRFLEYVSENKITNIQKAKGIAGLFGVMVQKEFSEDYNFNFRGENDIFNFVVGIGNKIKSGELSTDDITTAIESGIVDVAEEKGGKNDFLDTVSSAASFSKSVEQIQKEILALEEQYDEQNIDYYDFENRMDILEAELEKAKKAPKQTQVKTVKKPTQLSVQDIRDQIEQLDEDLYSGVIDDIDYEQRLDLLEEKLKQAELRISDPKKAQENQDKIVKESVDKFKKDVSEETVSDKNKNIAKINEEIANEMLELGANRVSDIQDPIKRKQIIDKLGKNNLGAVTNLTKKAAAAGKNLAIDDNLKVGYEEFFSGFSEELSALIKSYKVEVDGKRVPFGAYMNKNLPLRYGQILDNALKGRIEGSKSLDVQPGEKGYAGSIIADRSADLDAVTSAEMGLPVNDLIDVTTFRKVKDKVETIKESIDLTDVDLDNLTYRKIQDDYSGQVGAELIDMWDRNAEPEAGQDKNDFQKLAERIEGTRTLNYGKDTGGEAEVRAMQGLFLDYNDAVKFIKTMPEFNVAPFETTIDEQGRSIDLTEDARGYSTGISNKLLKEFYEPYIDPKSKSSDKSIKSRAITSPSGRGKGKTSQVAKVYRLKPEYRGKISRQTVQDLQRKIGITPAGEAFIPMKGKNRTEFGTALQGLTKMYATNVANTIIRKKIVEEDLASDRKPVEKLLADIGGGKSSIMFSKAANLGLNVDFETPQLGTILFSKKARDEYETVLRNKRPDLKNPKQQVNALIEWGNALNVKENKKAKYKKLGLYYMANGQVIMPEDGYKVVEAIRLSEINKIDPYSYKNPNELIEKYQSKTKGARINPDKVKEFSNKKVLSEGVTVYDVEFSKEGQLAVRKAIDTNWGVKANPWCLAARVTQEQRSDYGFFDTKETAEIVKEDFEANGEYESVVIEKIEHDQGNGNIITKFSVTATRPLYENYDQLGEAFSNWESYNQEKNGFKIAFQNNKLLSFRDGNNLEWWDRQDEPSDKIRLKDRRLSKESIVEEFMDPETGKKEEGNTIKNFIEDGNAKVKEIYDSNGDLKERSYRQEVEEDIFLSINVNNISAEERERTVKVDNTLNNTAKTISKFFNDAEGVTKTIINVVSAKYHEFTEQVEKDGIVVFKTENVKKFDKGETIYSAEFKEGEFEVLVDKLEDTDFERNTDLDEYFDSENQEQATIAFSSAVELVTEDFFKGKIYKLKVNGTQKQFQKSLEKLLKAYDWLMKNTAIPALPANHYINKHTTETDNTVFGKDRGELEWKRRKQGRTGFTRRNTKYNKGKFTSKTPVELFGSEETGIETNLFNGNIAKFNKRNGERWELIWTEIFRSARQNKQTIPLLVSLIKSSSYRTNHWHRLGAEFIGIEKGVSLDEAAKRYFDYEHAMQANQAAFVLWREALKLAYNETISYKEAEAIFKDKLEEVKENYKLIALSVESHRRVNKVYAKKMPEGWKNWGERYFNALVAAVRGGIDPEKIVFFSAEQNGWGKTAKEVFKVNTDGTPVISDGVKAFSKGRLDAEFNKILENKTGILATDEISEVKAKMMANNKRRFNIFIPPSAEDFVGLLYATLGKGKVGEKQMMFYDRTLIRPYARAMQAISRDRIDLGRAFKNIRKEFKATPKNLKKKVPGSLFNKEQAVRIYIWDSIGKEVPGLNVEEVNELANYVADNKELKDFAEQVIRLNPGSRYLSPKEGWETGTITTDLLETLNTSRRAKHLARWQQNVDEIFSKENLNKLEAAYGTSYRKAMENMLTRMKTGRNRTYGTDSQTAKWIDWVNGSVGTIMFLNARSAVLQTISAANFINFGDNNIFAAGKAFANQKQYWSDFAFLMNSDYLVERRDSLKININEADIAEAAQKKGARGAINYLLKLGFTPTKFADSFAIASGGAAFYRNRLNALIKKGMDPAAAEKAAMRDFIEKSEESQQSSRPDKISQEQAGPLGRVILAFANTPAQYARIIKKAASDLKNRRGSDKENISKIIYYGLAQNLLFNALQQAIFAVAFGDEEESDELSEKELNIVNGMLDGIIRGTGVGGAIFTVAKNAGLRIYKESNKNRPNYESVVDEALKISPPISSKISKLKSAGRTMSWDMKEIKSKGLDITSPAVGVTAKAVSATTNIPLDRVMRKIENLKAASDSELETYKRLALILGWGKWELGIKDEKWKDPNKKPKSKSRVRKTKERKIKQRKITIR